MSLNKKFGQRIRNLRSSRNLSQEELAFKANLDRTYVSDIENGNRNVSLSVIEKLSDALDLKISEVVKDL